MRSVSKIIKNVFNIKNSSRNPLGRWKTYENYETIDKKIILANHDHCGSEQCGCPKILKKTLDESKSK